MSPSIKLIRLTYDGIEFSSWISKFSRVLIIIVINIRYILLVKRINIVKHTIAVYIQGSCCFSNFGKDRHRS